MKITVPAFVKHDTSFPEVNIDLPEYEIKMLRTALIKYNNSTYHPSLCAYLESYFCQKNPEGNFYLGFFSEAIRNATDGKSGVISGLRQQVGENILRITWANATVKAIDKALTSQTRHFLCTDSNGEQVYVGDVVYFNPTDKKLMCTGKSSHLKVILGTWKGIGMQAQVEKFWTLLERRSLLRHFYAKDAENEPIRLRDSDDPIEYLGQVKDKFLVKVKGELRLVEAVELAMKELCWVEKLPVYKGDVLYDDIPSECTVVGGFGNSVYYTREGKPTILTISTKEVTWTKPESEPEPKPEILLEGTTLKVNDQVYYTDDESQVWYLRVDYIDQKTGKITASENPHAFESTDLTKFSRQARLFVDGEVLKPGDSLYLKDTTHPAYRRRYIFLKVEKGTIIFTKGEQVPVNRMKNSFTRVHPVIDIGGISVKVPEITPPKIGMHYWVTSLHMEPLKYTWRNDQIDEERLKKGFVHLSEENAKEHGEALRSFTKGLTS